MSSKRSFGKTEILFVSDSYRREVFEKTGSLVLGRNDAPCPECEAPGLDCKICRGRGVVEEVGPPR